MRLNKFLAQSGVASRRKSDELIQMATTEVNGKICQDPAYSVKDSDVIKYDGQQISPILEKVVIMLHKPKKVITINTNLFESVIASKLLEIQNHNTDCSIGSYPYFNYIEKKSGVNIIVSSWEREDLADIQNDIITMISLLGGKSSII